MSVCRPEECQTVHSAQEEQRRLQPAPHLQTHRAFTRNHINARHTPAPPQLAHTGRTRGKWFTLVGTGVNQVELGVNWCENCWVTHHLVQGVSEKAVLVQDEEAPLPFLRRNRERL